MAVAAGDVVLSVTSGSRGDRSDRSRSPALPNRSRDRSRSSGQLPGSPARSWVEEPGRRARRETQEGVEAVASQPPAVSEAAEALTALPSAVQDLARFFLSLSGSSSLGAIGGIAGVTASAAGSVGAVCPPTDAGGAVTTCTTAVMPDGAGGSPAAPAAVPGVSGEQQRKVESRSRGHRSRSSSDGTDRRAKKRARRRSPSPGHSSRRQERHYRSSSDSSDEDRADVSPPRSGCAHGGGASSSRAYDRSPRPGTSRSYARDYRYQSGAGRRSPAPSGAADDDRSSAFESVDFDRDDSFRSVLGLIRSFHGMEEPAGVPSARCKTSLASAYGLMSEVSPAFTLPASPLVRSLLDDTNLALSFWRTRPCTAFCLCQVAVIEGTTAPPLLLFLGCTQSHLVLPRSPSRKLVRRKKTLCPPDRSPRWRPCFLGCVRSRPGWTGGCRPAGVSGIIYRSRFVPTSNG